MDWYTNINNGELGTSLLIVYKYGDFPLVLDVPNTIDNSDLKVWKAQFVPLLGRVRTEDTSPDLLPEQCLQKFEELVKPILGVSEPGDTLVFHLQPAPRSAPARHDLQRPAPYSSKPGRLHRQHVLFTLCLP